MAERTLTLVAVVWGCLTIAQIGAAEQRGNKAWAKVPNPVPPSTASVSTGRQVYQRYCRACHHASGSGNGPYSIARGLTSSDFTDDTWDHGSTDGEIFHVIKDGTGSDLEAAAGRAASGGPSLVHTYEGRISDDDIWNVVNYIRTFAAKPR